MRHIELETGQNLDMVTEGRRLPPLGSGPPCPKQQQRCHSKDVSSLRGTFLTRAGFVSSNRHTFSSLSSLW